MKLYKVLHAWQYDIATIIYRLRALAAGRRRRAPKNLLGREPESKRYTT